MIESNLKTKIYLNEWGLATLQYTAPHLNLAWGLVSRGEELHKSKDTQD